MSLSGVAAPFDPFADAAGDDVATKGLIHIRIRKRNGRKSITSVEGLNRDLDFARILKALKKEFCCNGSVVKDEEWGQVIQLQGDQRANVKDFLMSEALATKDKIKVHGT